jgi:cytochrome P450
MHEKTSFQLAIEEVNRVDPYPFYAAEQTVPVREENGRFIVSGYQEVMALLHDPRLTSAPKEIEGEERRGHSLLRLDPPEHDRIRRIMMRQFGPPQQSRRISDLETEIALQAHALIDELAHQSEADMVAAFAHRLPFGIICKLLDIPITDEPKFRDWITTITGTTGESRPSPEGTDAIRQIGAYLTKVSMSRRGKAGSDMLSGLVNDEGPEGRLPEESVGATATLLLIAGHETTVNLIANGILTLLRHPEEIELLRQDRTRAVLLVEEILRYEPPVQFIQSRRTLADVEVGGVRIPADCPITLVLAAANRDPERFQCPHQFESQREDNQHLGFGSGIHSCFGAPLARLEGQIALQTFFDRIENPRLISAPPYRKSPLLRGPSELHIAYDRVRPGEHSPA